jgi:hypothetical protein
MATKTVYELPARNVVVKNSRAFWAVLQEPLAIKTGIMAAFNCNAVQGLKTCL